VAEGLFGGRAAGASDRRIVSRLAPDRLEALEHELRTPLAAIRAIAEILKDEADLSSAERAALLDALLVEQARLGRTLEALLDELFAG
jgi:signal transduction histidine kinase